MPFQAMFFYVKRLFTVFPQNCVCSLSKPLVFSGSYFAHADD